MLLQKSKKFTKLLVLGIVSTLSLISIANANKPTIDFEVKNNTDFNLFVTKLEGMDLLQSNPLLDRGTSTADLAVIEPGAEKKQRWPYFAPGIDAIAWKWKASESWNATKNYHQTHAILGFASPNDPENKVERPIQISQEFVNKPQTLEFNYGKQNVQIEVTIESKENTWGEFLYEEKYFDYTITVTQIEPARGTIK